MDEVEEIAADELSLSPSEHGGARWVDRRHDAIKLSDDHDVGR
jgi:hypothetical protein